MSSNNNLVSLDRWIKATEAKLAVLAKEQGDVVSAIREGVEEHKSYYVKYFLERYRGKFIYKTQQYHQYNEIEHAIVYIPHSCEHNPEMAGRLDIANVIEIELDGPEDSLKLDKIKYYAWIKAPMPGEFVEIDDPDDVKALSVVLGIEDKATPLTYKYNELLTKQEATNGKKKAS